MFNIMFTRKLVLLFVPSCGLFTISQKIYKDCFKILPIMLPLCLMLLETYYAQNYTSIIGLGLPVSLTSTIVKIMESVVKSSIFDHLISNNLVSPSQFGLLPGHSCTMQLLHVMDIITNSLDHGLLIDAIYLDLQKAFDSVLHNRLLPKIKNYGICRTFLNWIKGFLFDRHQCVVLNNCRYRLEKVLSGVPQESILKPLLFAIYMNDLSQSLTSSVFMFTDDTKLIHTIQSVVDHDQLQTDLNCLLKWCVKWELNFNISNVIMEEIMILGNIV